VKHAAQRIEDEHEHDDEDDRPACGVSQAQYLQFLTTCCQIKATKGL
jgi:hypothetical protein